MEKTQIKKDSELTPEELKKREKNRRNNAKKRAKKSKDSQATPSPVTKEISPEQEHKLSREEKTQQIKERKLSRIETDPNAQVVITDSVEAKYLAFSTREINMITDFARNKMGTDLLSTKDGIKLIDHFNEKIQKNINSFIKFAHELNVGSYFGLKDFNEEKQKAANRLELSIRFETPEEKKKRETLDKSLEKEKEEIEKLEISLAEAEEKYNQTLVKSQEAVKERIQSHIERVQAEKAEKKARIEAEKKAKEETSEQTEVKAEKPISTSK